MIAPISWVDPEDTNIILSPEPIPSHRCFDHLKRVLCRSHSVEPTNPVLYVHSLRETERQTDGNNGPC